MRFIKRLIIGIRLAFDAELLADLKQVEEALIWCEDRMNERREVVKAADDQDSKGRDCYFPERSRMRWDRYEEWRKPVKLANGAFDRLEKKFGDSA
jgi:hypothetical protein